MGVQQLAQSTIKRTTVTALKFQDIPLRIQRYRYEFDVKNEKKSDLRTRGRYLVFRPDLRYYRLPRYESRSRRARESLKHLRASVAVFLHTWPIELAAGREREGPCLFAYRC